MVRATGDFVRARRTRADRAFSARELQDRHTLYTHLSGLCFDIAHARTEGRRADEQALTTTYWPFSDKDPNFLKCAGVYAEYCLRYGSTALYNDWQVAGGGSLNYGVIDWQLPNDAKIAIIGDWGTGMDDATGLLLDVMKQHSPDAILHLGDIYYSGTPAECTGNFANRITSVFDQVLGQGNRIPVFTIPGNHDYYALGHGFYPMLPGLNAGLTGATQAASYFCLRTQDGGWQFLGMDTGYADADPLNQRNPAYAGPWIQPSEVIWHRDKLQNFQGATILLSHHQLFTANAKINGMVSSQSEFPYLNPSLMSAFQPFFRTKVAAWLWGHEHNFVLYENDLFGLSNGRLLGASAFEEATSETPYKNNYPNVVRFLDPVKYQLTPNPSGYYAHSYAIIDLSGRVNPTDPVAITYFQFPSWYLDVPPTPAGTVIFAEEFALPQSAPQTPLQYGMPIQLSVEGGLACISAVDDFIEYYPTIGATAVTLRLLAAGGQSGPVSDGAAVLIQTTEPKAGKYNLLGAWPTSHSLYYYSSGYSNEIWTIKKADTSVDEVIRVGDAVYLVSQSFAGQAICPTNNGYLTTTTDQPCTLFVIQAPGAA